jgi:hypothetical protein
MFFAICKLSPATCGTFFAACNRFAAAMHLPVRMKFTESIHITPKIINYGISK